MHEPERVRREEPARGVDEGGDDLAVRAPAFLEPALQRASLDELHRQVDLVAHAPHVVDRDDVGVRELGHRAGLAQQGVDPVLVRRGPRVQELEGHLSVELGVIGALHGTHRTSAQRLEREVAAHRSSLGERR